MIELEVCASSVASCMAAEEGGAHRIELCAGLSDGGITPSYGFAKTALQHCSLPIFPIIRPRGGDFLYSPLELEEMERDIQELGQLGVAGFVFGVLTPNGELDLKANQRLLAVSSGLPCTLHRAFDMVRNQQTALEEAIHLGFSRILTSGGQVTALKGVSQLREVVTQSAGRITIMAGSGVRPDNALEIVQKTGVTALHGTLQSELNSGMIYRNNAVSMGGNSDASEYLLHVTDTEKVRTLLSSFR